MNPSTERFIDMDVEPNFQDAFRASVLEGLGQSPKRLESKYFYDSEGDKLFQKIMALPEYYLTNCELEIFKEHSGEIMKLIAPDNDGFDLIELGAGDAQKSRHLIKHLFNNNSGFRYMPIDISGNILNVLEGRMANEVPGLEMHSFEGEYFSMLSKAVSRSEKRKVILLLGGNIGNMEKQEVTGFCRKLHGLVNPGDLLLIGFDLKKDPQIILDAYNDASGVTAEFNLNLLRRINRELLANFQLQYFKHYQTYDPLSGSCRSFLVSTRNQMVNIEGTSVYFEKDEVIHMETSQKYSSHEIRGLGEMAGFKTIGMLMDSKKWFADVIWQAE